MEVKRIGTMLAAIMPQAAEGDLNAIGHGHTADGPAGEIPRARRKKRSRKAVIGRVDCGFRPRKVGFGLVISL